MLIKINDFIFLSIRFGQYNLTFFAFIFLLSMIFTEKNIIQMLFQITMLGPIFGFRKSDNHVQTIITAISTRCSICAAVVYELYGCSKQEKVLGKYNYGSLQEGYFYQIHSNNTHYKVIFVFNGMLFEIESFWKISVPQITISKMDESGFYALEDTYTVVRYKVDQINREKVSEIGKKLNSLLVDDEVDDEVKEFFMRDTNIGDMTRLINLGYRVIVDDFGYYKSSDDL